MKKLIFIFFFITQYILAQIAVTEVYYDTPISEYLGSVKYNNYSYYQGEFIELYNYSDREISLDDWFLADYASSFRFPSGLTMKPGDFLLIAYKSRNNPDYFTQFFPSTVGKETQIIYQDKIILNNFKEKVSLYGKLGDPYHEKLPPALITQVEWEDKIPSINREDYLQKKSNYHKHIPIKDINFYTKSLQLADNADVPLYHYFDNANPLDAVYKPQNQKFEEIERVREYYQEHYALLNWAEYVKKLRNTQCDLSIPVIEQSGSYLLTQEERCFHYDEAGNFAQTAHCNTPYFTAFKEEDEKLKNKIILYPNPVSSLVKISWEEEFSEQIEQMKITSLNTGFSTEVKINAGGHFAEADLSSRPKGIYVLTIILKSGKSITKNIIKL